MSDIKTGDTVSFEYRANACSSVICNATRKAEVDEQGIWVRINNHYLRIEAADVTHINGELNDQYKSRFFAGDYHQI